MEFDGDSGCARCIANTWDPYAYGNRYSDGYRHRYSCTHPNTFTGTDGHSYSYSYSCIYTDADAYAYQHIGHYFLLLQSSS